MEEELRLVSGNGLVKTIFFLASFLFFSSYEANALTISLWGGGSGGGDRGYSGVNLLSPFVSGDLTFSGKVVKFGFFFDYNFITFTQTSTQGGIPFFGFLFRSSANKRFFFEAKAGFTGRTADPSQSFSSNGRIGMSGLGVGLGYTTNVGQTFGLTPRISLRILPCGGPIPTGEIYGSNGNVQALVDFSFAVSLDLFGRHNLIGWSGGGNEI